MSADRVLSPLIDGPMMAAGFCNKEISSELIKCVAEYCLRFCPAMNGHLFANPLLLLVSLIFIYSKFLSKTVAKFRQAEIPTKTNFIISSM